MLKVTIHSFKGYDNKSFEIPLKGSLLLSGNSGTGKTTLLEAISFCLYDAKGNVYPRSSKNSKKQKKTFVNIEFDNFVVYRQKRPTLLRVSQGEEVYENQVAQEIINERFGSFALWNAGAYIRQGSLCGFFGLSSSEKIKFFHEIVSFDTEKQQKLLDKVSDEIDDNATNVNRVVSKINHLKQKREEDSELSSAQLQEQLWNKAKLKSLNKMIQGHELCLEELPALFDTKIENLELERKEFNEKSQEKAEELRTTLSNVRQLIKMQQETEKKIMSLPEVTQSRIETLAEQMTVLKRKCQLSNQSQARKLLEEQIATIDEQIEDLPKIETLKYSSEQLQYWKGIYEKNHAPNLHKALTKIKETICYKEQLRVYDAYQEVYKKVFKLKDQLVKTPEGEDLTLLQSQLLELETQIKMLDIYNKELICPECLSHVYLTTDNVLVGGLDEIVSQECLKDERDELLVSIQKQEERQKMENELWDLEEQLKTLPNVADPGDGPHPTLNKYTLEQLLENQQKFQTKLDALQEIPGLTITEIRELLEEHNIQRQLNELSKSRRSLQKRLDQIPKATSDENADLLEEQLLETTTTHNRLLPLLHKRNTLLETVASFEKSKQELLGNDTCTGLQSKINEELSECEKRNQSFIKTVDKLSKTRVEILEQIKLVQVKELETKIHTVEKEIKESEKELQKYEKIKKCLTSAEYISVNDTLSFINGTLNEIINEFFNGTMNVQIVPLKELKTNGKIKPEIHLKIHYMGETLGSVSELSGGEQSRVSIAMAVAFSRLSASKFFILDESMSTLDIDMKETVVETVKRYLPNKVLVIVCHNTGESLYDQVLRFN